MLVRFLLQHPSHQSLSSVTCKNEGKSTYDGAWTNLYMMGIGWVVKTILLNSMVDNDQTL